MFDGDDMNMIRVPLKFRSRCAEKDIKRTYIGYHTRNAKDWLTQASR